jgi:ribonuclease HII
MLPVRREQKILSGSLLYVMGCDEVGRGSLAGPVVAGVVAFDKNFFQHRPAWGKRVNDSKQVSVRMRSELAFHIKQSAAAWSVGVVSAQVIDRINILQATKRAVAVAVQKIHMQLAVPSDKTFLLLDGNFVIPYYIGRQEAVVRGDASVFCIAAASIVAKVYRDELMVKLDKKFPGYEFKAHKGYGTKRHREALKSLGLSSIHRKTFC